LAVGRPARQTQRDPPPCSAPPLLWRAPGGIYFWFSDFVSLLSLFGGIWFSLVIFFLCYLILV
jgi:hypothetical protein